MPQDLRSTLMQMFAAKMGVGQSSDLKSALLARLREETGDNPVWTALDGVLAQAEAQRGSSRPEAPHADHGASESLRQMRRLLRAARDQLKLLQARSDGLASALGACALCWGADPVCLRCEGRGLPGWSQPDPMAYATWVEPALHKITPRRPGVAKATPGNSPAAGAGNHSDPA